ncbi:MAG: hypothetical protein E5Y74_11490 [Mesorhizobium sp.]|nr:MAG: hypothetical protein E5Y74_11490 [Mesorhizobium sp.]
MITTTLSKVTEPKTEGAIAILCFFLILHREYRRFQPIQGRQGQVLRFAGVPMRPRRTYAGIGAPQPMRFGAYTSADLRAAPKAQMADAGRRSGRNVTDAYHWSTSS